MDLILQVLYTNGSDTAGIIYNVPNITGTTCTCTYNVSNTTSTIHKYT